MSTSSTPLVYQEIAEDISYSTLSDAWQRINLDVFSNEISLYDYQRDALKNCLTFLHYYFLNTQTSDFSLDNSENINERKKKLFNEIRKFDIPQLDSLGISRKGNLLLFNKLKQFYSINMHNSDIQIDFQHFVNRMSFWMATGSGKTIVLVKLIEILETLISTNSIPKKEIMILTHRDDLVQQIKLHVKLFNQQASRKIVLWELSKFEDVKRGSVLSFKDDINVFIYRSDLISEETKEKQLGFEDIENGGNWYLLLDEAHKGDKADSKRQLYYSIFTRNGFLFNFSATFTDIWDILTTVYNFNLDTFTRRGYGKNVYLSQQEFTAFKTESHFDEREKKKIVLKSLLVLALTKQSKKNLDSILQIESYHKPLLVSLVNSVNTQDADLEIFFKELEHIASEEITYDLFEEVKLELQAEFDDFPQFVFGSGIIDITPNMMESIKLHDLRRYIFHSERKGSIEVIKIPGNDKELIFKLKTADLPFALMRVGNCGKWVKEKLQSYNIEETYENESYFEQINENSDNINILMGSRAFYEGWDSNRPNVMLFINIGHGDAKKYVTQSIGRGVRIEPLQNKRKRLISLQRENDPVINNIFTNVDSINVSLIETLFVFGTSKKNVERILDSIKYQNKSFKEFIELTENPLRKGKSLLIPIYTDISHKVDVKELPKFGGDRALLDDYINWLNDDRVLYAHYSSLGVTEPLIFTNTREYIEKGTFLPDKSIGAYHQLRKLMKHVNIQLKDVHDFKELTDEIIHFKRIRVTLDDIRRKKLENMINEVSLYEDISVKEIELKKQLQQGVIDIHSFTDSVKKIASSQSEVEFKINGSTLIIKNILNHYYVPVIISEEERIKYINHTINVESEIEFIKQLDDYLNDENNDLKKIDWWMFSKIDEHLDEIYIPYYNINNNTISKFKPDFIFWFKNKEKYHIIFVDPKGTKHTDYQYKVDGYRQIFELNGNKKIFLTNEGETKIHLFLYTKDKNTLSEGYKNYWFDNIDAMFDKILS